MLIETNSSPEDSEYEVACMQPGIGKLDMFPSIWGRKYILLLSCGFLG